MDLTALSLPATWTIAGWLAAAPVFGCAAWVAPWSRFGESELVHVWYGGIFFLVVLWSIQATVGAGFTFHLLGVTAVTLSMGPALAIVGSALAVALLIVVRDGLWVNGGIAFLTMSALPVAVTWVTLRFAERFLPPNFFIYVFVGAFLGAALAFGAAGLAGATVLTLAAGLPRELVFGEYVPYLLYLAFGEATVTGMLVTLGVAYRPRWVATFDDARYLKGR
jgi:uncharacterized membrane protein